MTILYNYRVIAVKGAVFETLLPLEVSVVRCCQANWGCGTSPNKLPQSKIGKEHFYDADEKSSVSQFYSQ